MATVYTLGTAGGPRYWRGASGAPARAGISTAVTVGDATYVIDCGAGTWSNLVRAGLRLDSLEAVLLTHLHSDHVVDLPGLALFGLFDLEHRAAPLPVLGPGDRGGYRGIDPADAARAIEHPACTPGTRELVHLLSRAFATDLNERVLCSRRARPDEVLDARDIAIPDAVGFEPDDSPTPPHEPFAVFEDDRVRINAVLVAHPPIAPAFAFRIDTEEGSVTVSGDTAACDNVVRLAAGTDLLLHEAIDVDWIARSFGGSSERTVAMRDHHLTSHTSVADAVRIADDAGARRLALHHLVPGDAPVEAWRAAVADAGRPVAIAEDGQAFELARHSTPARVA